MLSVLEQSGAYSLEAVFVCLFYRSLKHSPLNLKHVSHHRDKVEPMIPLFNSLQQTGVELKADRHTLKE